MMVKTVSRGSPSKYNLCGGEDGQQYPCHRGMFSSEMADIQHGLSFVHSCLPASLKLRQCVLPVPTGCELHSTGIKMVLGS